MVILDLDNAQQAFTINTSSGTRDILRFQNQYYTRLKVCSHIHMANHICSHNLMYGVSSLILNQVPPEVWIQLDGTSFTPRLSEWIKEHHDIQIDPFECPEILPNPLMKSYLKWIASMSNRFFDNQSIPPLIMYIDDNLIDGSRFGEMARMLGYRYFHIQNPVLALPIIIEHQPDLICLDLVMAITNGYELCAQIRRIPRFQSTPIIMAGYSPNLVNRARGRLVGASGVVAKPFHLSMLQGLMQRFNLTRASDSVQIES